MSKKSAPKTEDSITLHDAVLAFESLSELTSQPTDAHTAKRLLSLHNWLKPHVDEYIKNRDKEVEIYGEQQENGSYKIPPLNAREYSKAIEPLNNRAVDISDAPKLKFAYITSLKITANALNKLSIFLD